MLETAFAQLRYAASIVFGIPFSARSLDRLVDGLLAIYDASVTFALTSTNTAAVAQICQHLEGCPWRSSWRRRAVSCWHPQRY